MRGPHRLAGLLLGMALSAPAVAAQEREPCRAAAVAVDSGWTRWRAGDLADAAALFRRGATACPGFGPAWTGLAYAALRDDAVDLAIARFDSAAARQAPDMDLAMGLGMATYRAGLLTRAYRAFTLADSLIPGDSTVSAYLANIPVPVDPALLPSRSRSATLRLDARIARRIFEVPDGHGGWRPFWMKAVNIGAALPGRHPSEFPPNDGTYESWIRTVAQMGANSVRVYTIHPPHFYTALRNWNLAHPDSALWLIHGVWTELPPGEHEEDYDDPEWNAEFLAEMTRVVDLIHGHAAIAPRPGHASGLYTSDVSRWTLGYIIGREWEPYSVQAYAQRHPQRTRFRGSYVTVDGGNAVDVWLAGFSDSLLSYEMNRWNAQRPLAYTNWPTLDPLTHPTETSRAEESAWLRRRGERVPEPSREYDNDVIGLDANVMRATAAYQAGLFASYHAYPYYPDFMVLDPGYARAVGPEGPSHYLGYLRELVAHHGDMPVVISEYGVPSSRGNAHLQPQGWHHGGHDEQAQADINARLTRDIAASGAAGVGLFALIDEWFKKNWLVIDFEQPAERNRLWLNTLDPEQNYGIIAMRPGLRDSAIVIDGQRGDWAGQRPLHVRDDAAPAVPAAQRIDALWVHHDEAFVYLRLDVGAIDWSSARYLIGIDTYDRALGDTKLPVTGSRSPVGLEFVLDLRGPDDSRLLVDTPYNLYKFVPIEGAQPPAAQQVYNEPFRSRANADGRYDTLYVTPNRRTFGRDGTVFPAQRIERNLLRHARQQETTLADWFADPATNTIELRIPWGMLHLLDPSSRYALHGVRGPREPRGRVTDGFRFVLQAYAPGTGRSGATAAAPPVVTPLWTWPTWETPRWYAERKPLFEAMRETFARIPDSGPSDR